MDRGMTTYVRDATVAWLNDYSHWPRVSSSSCDKLRVPPLADER
jgi:hypothetical protein